MAQNNDKETLDNLQRNLNAFSHLSLADAVGVFALMGVYNKKRRK